MSLLTTLCFVLFAAPQDLQTTNSSPTSPTTTIHGPTGEEVYQLTTIEHAIGKGYAIGRHGALLPVSEADDGIVDLNGDGDFDDLVAHYHDFATGTSRNLELSLGWVSATIGPWITVCGPRFVFLASEYHQGTDLTGDGDAADLALFVFDSEDGSLRNLGTAVERFRGFETDGQWANLVSFHVPESDQGGEDLNGDGDVDDLIFFVYDTVADRLVNTELDATCIAFDGGRAMLMVYEGQTNGQDWNDDGDNYDYVAQIWDARTDDLTNLGLATFIPFAEDPGTVRGRYAAVSVAEATHGPQDLNGDGDAIDEVIFVHDLITGVTRNSGLAGRIRQSLMTLEQGLAAFTVEETSQGGADLNGDGDSDDSIMFVYDMRAGAAMNLGLAGSGVGPPRGVVVPIPVDEQQQGQTDRNGDGDTQDQVLAVHHLLWGITINTGLASPTYESDRDKVLLHADEVAQGIDLNGDGDRLDPDVLQIIDVRQRTLTNVERAVARTFNSTPPGHRAGSSLVGFVVDEAADARDHDGDGQLDDFVMHVYDLDLGVATSLGVPGSVIESPLVLGDRMLFRAYERAGDDWNGDGDSVDEVAMLLRRVQ